MFDRAPAALHHFQNGERAAIGRALLIHHVDNPIALLAHLPGLVSSDAW
jgi:hypothetical protein